MVALVRKGPQALQGSRVSSATREELGDRGAKREIFLLALCKCFWRNSQGLLWVTVYPVNASLL